MKKIRVFRPQAERLDLRVVPSDLGVVPQVDLRPVPLLTPAPDPTIYPIPLLTLPGAPAGDGTAPDPEKPVTGPVSATILIAGHTYHVTGTTDGVRVGLNTTGIPCGEGDILMVFPDGTTGGYQGTINATNRLRNVQAETDDDGVSYMYLPCNCTVPAIDPADLGVSA